MPRRILYIHGISEIGGSERDLLQLLRLIDRQQWEPYVVCPEGPLSREVEKLKVSVYPMRLPAWRKLIDVFSIPRAVWLLFKSMRDMKINLVHVNDYWWAPISYIACRMAGLPCIVHIRQEIEPRRVREYWLRRPQKLVAVSNRIRDVAIESGVDPTRIMVIYSGIDVALTSNPAEDKRVRDDYHLSDRQPVIGTVANLFPRKGHEYLLQALIEVRKKLPDIHCLIIGEGDNRYRAMLLEMIQTHGLTRVVTLAGFQEDMMAHIAAMDVFVLPSVMEGFGIVLLEAMAMGRPIVATAVGGIPEVIEDHVTGVLVPPRDPKALAQKILYLLENPQVAEKLGHAGRARVVERFSLQQMISHFHRLYGELVS